MILQADSHDVILVKSIIVIFDNSVGDDSGGDGDSNTQDDSEQACKN